MKILVVTTWFPSHEAPAQAPFNLEHAKAVQLRHDVSVVHVRLGSRLPAAAETYAGLPVQRISLNPRRPWTAVSVLRTLLGESSTSDVLHTMAFSSALVAALPRSTGEVRSRLCGVERMKPGSQGSTLELESVPAGQSGGHHDPTRAQPNSASGEHPRR